MDIPTETTHTHEYELQIKRWNPKGRPLSTLRPLKSNNREEVQAEYDRRMAERADWPEHMQRRSQLEIIQHKQFRPE